MSRTATVELSAGNLRLELNPSVGGSILGLDWRDGDRRTPVLRKCNNGRENVLDAASFPLVPYVNRIRGGVFTFRGREVRLQPNMAGDPSPLHGQGWLSPWRVESAGETDALLSFDHAPGEWPWDYQAEQQFALDEAGLSLILTCRNISDGADAVRAGPASLFQLLGSNADRRAGDACLDDRRACAAGRQGPGERALRPPRPARSAGRGSTMASAAGAGARG